MPQPTPNPVDLAPLWVLSRQAFTLGDGSLHGPHHWQRVERNALEIAPHSGADVLVVRLFAILHDSHRHNEWHDPEHGLRAAQWTEELQRAGQLPPIDAAQLRALREAMIWHDKGRVSGDATIGTCWDADRLDLPRVGVAPREELMSTARGKHLAREISAARGRRGRR